MLLGILLLILLFSQGDFASPKSILTTFAVGFLEKICELKSILNFVWTSLHALIVGLLHAITGACLLYGHIFTLEGIQADRNPSLAGVYFGNMTK